MALGQMMMPQGTQGLGGALQAASPLLLAMAQGMRQGQGPFAHAGTGMAAMMAMREDAEEKKRREEAGKLIGGLFGGMGGAQAPTAYTAPTNVPRLDRNNPEAIAADAMGALGKGTTPQAILEGLIERGLPEHVARGFLMNMRDESGLDPGINERNPTVPGSRGGFGLYQLTGPRREAYEAYARQRGVDPSDVNAQLDFLMAELQGPEAAAAQRILSTKNPGEAAAAIATHFLRPAKEHLQRRVAQYTGGQGYQSRIDPQRAQTILMHPDIPDAVKTMVMQQVIPETPDPMDALEMEHQQLQNASLRRDLQSGPDMSAAEERIQRIQQAYGVDERAAIGIADGVLQVSRDPVDDTIIITNLATGEVSKPSGQEPPPVQETPTIPEAPIDPGNIEGALGVSGVTTGAVNTIADFFGLGQPFEGSAEAETQLGNLATRTVQTLSAEWPGRPSNLTREMIEGLTVRPPFVGEGRALQKFEAMRREISRAIVSAQRATQEPGYTPQQRADARAALDDLIPLLTDYNAIVTAMQGRGGDVTDEDRELIERYK